MIEELLKEALVYCKSSRRAKQLSLCKLQIRDEIQPSIIQALAELQEPCVWTYDEFHDMWETECGTAFCFEDGTLKDHNVNGCPNCLHPIEEKK